MPYLLGDTLTEYITLTGPDLTPITGALFPDADRLTADPNGAPFPATVTGVGQGVYRVEYAVPSGAAPGEYFVKLRANDPDRQVFAVRWEVMGRANLYIPGDTLTYTFVVLDTENNDVLGATFPESDYVTADPLGATFPITVEELGAGVYRVSAVTATDATPGHWFARVTDDTAIRSVYECEWQVLTNAQAARLYTPAFEGLTRRAIRRMVLDKIGDLIITTATADSGSSTWIDDVTLTGEAGTWAGRELLVTSGTPANIGQVRHVSGSSRAYTVQFSRSLPFPVFAGDEAEIINTRGGGFRFQQVHRAIDACLATAKVKRPLMYEVEAVFDRTTRTIPIPPEFDEIHAVQFRAGDADAATGWGNVKRGKVLGDDGWAVDHATRTVVIGGGTGTVLDGAAVRLYGLGPVQPLADDDDSVEVNPEWIANAVAAHLLLHAVGGPRALTPEWERKGSLFQQMADRLVDTTRPRRKPNSVRV